MTTCPRCGNTRELFHRVVPGSDYPTPVRLCGGCHELAASEWAQITAARARARDEQDKRAAVEQVFSAASLRCGLTPEQFAAMHSEQDGRCGVCARRLASRGRRVHVDHCHRTGVIRGLLCAGCNSWLGKRRDDLAMLRRAVAWLERGEQRAADPEWTMRVKERSSSPASDG